MALRRIADVPKKARGSQADVALSSVRVPRKGLRPLLLLYLTALNATPSCDCLHLGYAGAPTLQFAGVSGVDGAVR